MGLEYLGDSARRVPNMTGQYIMNSARLKKFLGNDYRLVIEKTNAEAFADLFKKTPSI